MLTMNDQWCTVKEKYNRNTLEIKIQRMKIEYNGHYIR